MRRIIYSVVTALALIFSREALGASEDQERVRQSAQIYAKMYAGGQMVPGALVEFATDKVRGDAIGYVAGARVGRISKSKKYSAGVNVFHGKFSGDGVVTDISEFKRYGVDGKASGKAKVNVTGVGIEAERRFKVKDNVVLFVRLGPLGVGVVGGEIKGSFKGHVTKAPQIKVEGPGKRKFHNVIPIVGAGVGVEWNITKHISAFAGPYWNTGFGAEAGIAVRF